MEQLKPIERHKLTQNTKIRVRVHLGKKRKKGSELTFVS